MPDIDWQWMEHKKTGKLYLRVTSTREDGQVIATDCDELHWLKLYLFLMRGFFNNCGVREWFWAGMGALVLIWSRAIHPRGWRRDGS